MDLTFTPVCRRSRYGSRHVRRDVGWSGLPAVFILDALYMGYILALIYDAPLV